MQAKCSLWVTHSNRRLIQIGPQTIWKGTVFDSIADMLDRCNSWPNDHWDLDTNNGTHYIIVGVTEFEDTRAWAVTINTRTKTIVKEEYNYI